MKKWFISHPHGGHHSTPTFFAALEHFQGENSKVKLVLPPQEPIEVAQRKIDVEKSDLVLAEVSVASTGSGIDLGLAYSAQKPIIAFHQGTGVISPIISVVARSIHTYLTEEQILKVLRTLA